MKSMRVASLFITSPDKFYFRLKQETPLLSAIYNRRLYYPLLVLVLATYSSTVRAQSIPSEESLSQGPVPYPSALSTPVLEPPTPALPTVIPAPEIKQLPPAPVRPPKAPLAWRAKLCRLSGEKARVNLPPSLKHSFVASYEDLLMAFLAAASRKGLLVKQVSSQSGQILLGVSAAPWQELVANLTEMPAGTSVLTISHNTESFPAKQKIIDDLFLETKAVLSSRGKI